MLGLTIPDGRAEKGGDRHNLPQPDFDETGFVGRREEARAVLSQCLGTYPVVTVLGEGGLGKTALALKVAYELLDQSEQRFESIIWATSKSSQLTGSEVVTIRDSIKTSLGLFGEVAARLAGARFEDAVNEVLEYMEEFRVLVVLDNLETVVDERVRSFLGRLPAGGKVLITSRVGLGAFEYPYRLRPMDGREAAQLLRATAEARGIADLSGASSERLLGYCRRMHDNPGFIKWFVSAVQAGRRPEEVLSNPATFLNFCMQNVYEYISGEGRAILRAMLAAPGYQSQAGLCFLTELGVDDLQRGLQQLLTTNMAVMSVQAGAAAHETLYSLAELPRAYVTRHHPP